MFPCELKQEATRPALSIRFRSPAKELPSHFDQVYGALCAYLDELGEPHAEVAFAAYYNMDMQDLEVEAGFTVPRPLPGKGNIQASEVPGGMYAICHYTGPYDETEPAYNALLKFIKDSGYAQGEVFYEWYLSGPEVPPQEAKTDLVVPVILSSAREAV